MRKRSCDLNLRWVKKIVVFTGHLVIKNNIHAIYAENSYVFLDAGHLTWHLSSCFDKLPATLRFKPYEPSRSANES